MGDKRVYNYKTPHNAYPMGYELVRVAYNYMNPDDILSSRQRVEQICRDAELKIAKAMSNDPYCRDTLAETVEAPRLNDQQRMMTRMIGLNEGMVESDDC